MPNRIIRESICTSDNLDRLSPFEENMFYRLMVNCDDYGRMDAREKILEARLFPLKRLEPGRIAEGLRALAAADLILLYEAEGRPYLQIRTWEKHQQIRARKSRYPAPEGDCARDDIHCDQMISDDSKCPRNPIQSESNPNPNPKPNPKANRNGGDGEPSPGSRDARFEEFWKAYPRKADRTEAQKAFENLRPDEKLMETLLAAIGRQKQTEQWRKQDGQFIPNPATWLRHRRWEDDVGPASRAAKGNGDYAQRDYAEPEESLEDMMKRLGGSRSGG